MIKTYRSLCWTIVALVVVQAVLVAWGSAGESRFVDEGGVIDKALIEAAQAGGELPFPEVVAFPVHGLNGGLLLPVVALVLLGCSFAARLLGARSHAAALFGLVVLQGQAGYLMGEIPAVGIVHGANALLILVIAVRAARRPVLDQALETATASAPTAPATTPAVRS